MTEQSPMLELVRHKYGHNPLHTEAQKQEDFDDFDQWLDVIRRNAKADGLRLAQQIIVGEHSVQESRDREGYDLISESTLIRLLDDEIEDLEGKRQ